MTDAERRPGVAAVRVAINGGRPAVGNDRVHALVEGDVRISVLFAWPNQAKMMGGEGLLEREILA